MAYEGGQHITANALVLQDDAQVISFHTKINKDPHMKKVYQQTLNEWKEAVGKIFFHFVELGASSKYGSWGVLEHLGQKTSPQWEALLEFNKTPCWFEECL